MRHKTRIQRLLHILLSHMPGQRDTAQSGASAQLPHQLQPAAIGQAQVADHQVEASAIRTIQRITHRAGYLNRMAVSRQELPHQLLSVQMIFHQQDPKCLTHARHSCYSPTRGIIAAGAANRSAKTSTVIHLTAIARAGI